MSTSRAATGELLRRAQEEGHLRVEGTGRAERVTYVALNHSEIFADPEEQVRASFYAELIYHYGYDPSRIGVEVVVPDRRPLDRADLVVYRDTGRTSPYAVIECKREGISDAELDQAVEQAVGNGTWAKLRADYVMVVAGDTRLTFDFTDRYGIFERNANIVADLPIQYGRPEEFKYHKGTTNDLISLDKERLISVLRKCHQTLWGGGKLSPPSAFSELSKMIFVKISDEKALRKVGNPYAFQIKTHESPARLASRIRELYQSHVSRDPEVFSEAIKANDLTLRTIVSHLEGVNLSDTDVDVKGVAFETFMDGFFKGDFGQYFTPREVINFCVEVLEPTSEDFILDPACGSGGFLLHALSHIMETSKEYFEEGSPQHLVHWREFAQSHLYGIEINDEIARISKMNMILHEDGHSNIICEDALAPIDRAQRHNKRFTSGSFSLVLTNPPFGAQVHLTHAPWIGDYELGFSGQAGARKTRKTQKTEILFVERIYEYLQEGGRSVVILPDGVLANSSTQYVRDYITDRFRILAVVSLPTSAFTHFGTTVKASLVFVQKRARNDPPSDDEQVFMAMAETVGYDNTGRVANNQLPEILAAYREFRVGTAK